MKRKIWIFLLGCITAAGYCQPIELSVKAEISIITCGPGQDELYNAFGHNAIRVFDPQHALDVSYNYGAFDFDQPNFYLNYMRGLLNFKLEVNNYAEFRDAYIYFNRSIDEQVLDLSHAQKQRVFNFLYNNALPKNSTYRYDYFYDNCATNVRDVFINTLKDSIRFDSTLIDTRYSFRQITDWYLHHQLWGDLGIDIGLGMPVDKIATRFQYMFIPEYIKILFGKAFINIDGQWIPFVKETTTIYKPLPVKIINNLPHPWVVFCMFLALGIGLSFSDWKRKKVAKWFDLLLFGVVGLLGLILFLLWTVTDHHATRYNLNLLWAFPAHLTVVAILWKHPPYWVKKYFLFVFIGTIFLLAFWFLLPQLMNNALLPLVVCLAIRAFIISQWIEFKKS